MVRRLLALFLLVNVVGVVANLPRILAAVDGVSAGRSVAEWVVGVGTAAGDLIGEMGAQTLTPEEVVALQEDLRAGTLTDPLDDASVRALVDLWATLRDAGAQLQADELRELLVDQGIDPTEVASDVAREPTGTDGLREVDAGAGFGVLGG
jgi:hypothetical protein